MKIPWGMICLLFAIAVSGCKPERCDYEDIGSLIDGKYEGLAKCVDYGGNIMSRACGVSLLNENGGTTIQVSFDSTGFDLVGTATASCFRVGDEIQVELSSDEFSGEVRTGDEWLTVSYYLNGCDYVFEGRK